MRPTRNWLELPSDLMVNILHRIGVIDILENAQKVCTTWHKICKEPTLWRVVHMDYYSYQILPSKCREMCKHVVDRSQGQLVHLSVNGFCDDEIIHYVASRSSQLECLEIVHCQTYNYAILSEAFKKLLVIDELSFITLKVGVEVVEVVCRYCPLLKMLKLNQKLRGYQVDYDGMAIAIGKNLPQLTHLELTGYHITNTGLQAILDGCYHLETLDLHMCSCTDLNGELGKRCAQHIKNLKLSTESLRWCPHINENADEEFDLALLYDTGFDGDGFDDGYFDFD